MPELKTMITQKLSAEARNAKIYNLLSDFFKQKKSLNKFFSPFDSKEVESLFKTSIWGHREIVLTILMARLIDPKFKASENFYACNPRSIFEQPIRKVLRKHEIPHRKSGPLNVAKNTQKINKDWAADKHGGEIAMNVVKIVKKIESVPEKELYNFALAFIIRYKQEAKRIKELKVKLPSQENPVFLAKLCIDLTNEVTDGGATPQTIVGLIMEAFVENRKSDIKIVGHRDSVSTTNTTSKKPGDIIEQIQNDSEIIYEVTTKIFSDDRMIESYEAVMGYNQLSKDVIVICRPQDVPESIIGKRSSYLMATTQFHELAYYFINIFDYFESSFVLLTPTGRKFFYEKLVKYVNQINTSEKVKIYFKQWHSKNKLL